MPAFYGWNVGGSPSNSLYFCVSPVITWFVVVVPVACAKLKYREMFTSPAISINALIIKEKLIFPIAFLDIDYSNPTNPYLQKITLDSLQ